MAESEEDMKKIIKNLLSSEEAYLKINDMFTLRRWTRTALGHKADMLELEFNKANISGHALISSRTVQGIINEVAECMELLMFNYSQDIVKRWKGGLL